ncbi:hypothetical protein Y032_0122g1108 [Ancylostoma ceylanicum]|nr:hypothetical protein Y032_0122g1108 [Ancylostoma ceylanicum]
MEKMSQRSAFWGNPGFAAGRHRTAASHEDRWKLRKSHQSACAAQWLLLVPNDFLDPPLTAHLLPSS